MQNPEIAAKLGISITTVSKALKNYSDVSPKTKAAVIDLAKQLNFTPNNFALYLKSNESKTIGLIIPEIVHHFFGNVVSGVVQTATSMGYLVIVLQSNESVELEKQYVNLLINKRVDGILISLSNESNAENHLKEILNKKIPLVQFDKICKMIPSSKILIDDQQAAFNAVEHLILKGCRVIAHVRGPTNPQNSIDRFLGYKKALEHYAIPYNPELVFTCTNVLYEEGIKFAKEIFSHHKNIDGIFVITDLVALGVLNGLLELGVDIPNQVKIIGFSNWFISSISKPKLSTINQPGFEMGVQAVNLLL
ncbi:MAG: LacI family transcriptional regulator, partial [Pedobacter sp.]